MPHFKMKRETVSGGGGGVLPSRQSQGGSHLATSADSQVLLSSLKGQCPTANNIYIHFNLNPSVNVLLLSLAHSLSLLILSLLSAFTLLNPIDISLYYTLSLGLASTRMAGSVASK